MNEYEIAKLEPSQCKLHNLRQELLSVKNHPVLRTSQPVTPLATAVWYPQTFNCDEEVDVFHYISLEALKEKFQDANFKAILNCPCSHCVTYSRRALDSGYTPHFDNEDVVKSIKQKVIDQYCRIFALLLECRVPIYIQALIILEDSGQARVSDKFSILERSNLAALRFKREDPESSVFNEIDLNHIIDRQILYSETKIAWGSRAMEAPRFNSGCRLPIQHDATPLYRNPLRSNGTQGNVFALNILHESASAEDFLNQQTTLMGKDIKVNLKGVRTYPFVIKIFHSCTIGRKELEWLRRNQRYHTDYRKYICPDLASFSYGSEYCIIFPRALGSLYDLYNGDLNLTLQDVLKSSTWKGTTSMKMWEQLLNVARGLIFIHKCLNSQHLDIKPSNILIFETPSIRESEFDPKGKSVLRPNGELPIGDLSGAGSMVFRICDLGERNIPSASGGSGENSGSTTASSPPAFGHTDWAPPESSSLRSPGSRNNQSLEAYDYWSFGGILLEGTAFDIWGPEGFRGFRRERRDQGQPQNKGLQFNFLDQGKPALKPIVDEAIQSLKEFHSYPVCVGEVGNPRILKDEMPPTFFHEISALIARLLSIKPEDRRSGESIDTFMERSFNKALKDISQGQSNPENKDNTLSPSLELDQSHLPIGSASGSLALYKSVKWLYIYEDPRSTSWVRVSGELVDGKEIRNIHESVPRSGKWDTSLVISVSLQTKSFEGPFIIKCSNGTEKTWRFNDSEEGFGFFSAITGLRLVNSFSPPTNVKIVRLAVSPPGILSIPQKFRNFVATLSLLTDSPTKDGTHDSRTIGPSVRASISSLQNSVHSEATISASSSRNNRYNSPHKRGKGLIEGDSYLLIVPDDMSKTKTSFVFKSEIALPEYHNFSTITKPGPIGIVSRNTKARSIDKSQTEIHIEHQKWFKEPAKVLTSSSLEVPVREDKFILAGECAGKLVLQFPDEEIANLFCLLYNDIRKNYSSSLTSILQEKSELAHSFNNSTH
ncbi:hypothetical protein TWF694_007363 [Orbilia ellipsospora]|uniref:non-specific serine/threonine protein kinase n=1 Tax=Orbilia ellipsospora TaxID=2528407 RepID=A0AAV9XIY9_9PEZI